MLDLTVFQEQTMELKLFSGEVINLRKPSQKLLLEMLSYESKMKGVKDPIKVINSFSDILTKILNTNKEGIEFSMNDVKEMFSPEVGQVVIEAYMKFVNNINKNPN